MGPGRGAGWHLLLGVFGGLDQVLEALPPVVQGPEHDAAGVLLRALLLLRTAAAALSAPVEFVVVVVLVVVVVALVVLVAVVRGGDHAELHQQVLPEG